MPALSPAREAWPILPELELLNRGKVRDNYRLNAKRTIVVTDGISARDYVLDALIPKKGVFLNAMTVFWLRMLEEHGIKHHMLAYGSGIDDHLPEALRGDVDRQSRTMIVRDLVMDPVEYVVRAYLAGSSVGPYNKTHEVCGHKLPSGLQDGDELPCFLLTPTTKAQEGHDENVPAEEIIRRHSMASYLSLKVYQIGYNYALKRGIVIPDTKFEWSDDVLADEVLNFDSSRFWSLADWLISRKPATGRKAPGSYDKDPIRAWLDGEITKWCKAHGVEKMDPENPEHVAAVHGFVMPELLIRQSYQRYRYIFWRLINSTLEDYLRSAMHVDVPLAPPKNVVVLLGSDHDWPAIQRICEMRWRTHLTVHILSCDRNPLQAAEFAKDLAGVDAVVGVGGKSLRLPSAIDAFAHANHVDVPVIGVALGKPGSKELLAAQLAIEQIPSQPVIMDEIVGEVYTGPQGLEKVLIRLDHGELPPSKPRTEKEPQFNFWTNFTM